MNKDERIPRRRSPASDATVSVTEWLHNLGLAQYASAFTKNAIDWQILPKLSGDDLKEIGIVAVGHRRRLLEAISALPAAENNMPAPTLPAAEERRRLFGWRGLGKFWAVIVGSVAAGAIVLQVLRPPQSGTATAPHRHAQTAGPAAPARPAGSRPSANPVSKAAEYPSGSEIATLLAKAEAEIAENPDGLPPGSKVETMLTRVAASLPQASLEDRQRGNDLASNLFDRAIGAEAAGKVDEGKRWFALGSILIGLKTAPNSPPAAPPRGNVTSTAEANQSTPERDGAQIPGAAPSATSSAAAGAEPTSTSPVSEAARHPSGSEIAALEPVKPALPSAPPAAMPPPRSGVVPAAPSAAAPASTPGADRAQPLMNPPPLSHHVIALAPSANQSAPELDGAQTPEAARSAASSAAAGAEPTSPAISLSLHVPDGASAATAETINKLKARLRFSFAQTEMYREPDGPRVAIIRYAAPADHSTARDVGQILGAVGYGWRIEKLAAANPEARNIDVWIPNEKPAPAEPAPRRGVRPAAPSSH